MQAESILHQWLEDARLEVHESRKKAVVVAVGALLEADRLSLTSLGRAVPGPTAPKHSIKRMDRLLGNPRLQTELGRWFAAMTCRLVGGVARPVLLVDWTHLGERWWALSAAVAVEGRAISLVWHVHRKQAVGDRKHQRAFLDQLAALLPEGCQPTLVFDGAGGFKRHWLQAIEDKGWYWVTRMSSNDGVRPLCDGQRRLAQDFAAQARRGQSTDLGVCWIYGARNGRQARVAVAPEYQRKAARPAKSRPFTRRNRGHRETIERAKKPWVIASNHLDWLGQRLLAVYALRMQIEETYRDTKSSRFGWSLEQARANSAGRWAVLLLVASLAMALVTLVGRVAEAEGLHRRYQANTVRDRRVLSWFTLGRQLIRRREAEHISWQTLVGALAQLVADLQRLAEDGP